MRNKTEQTAVPSEFRLFRGREKPLNSVSNHFSEERNPRNSIPNHFSEEKNSWNSIPNHFPEEKNPRNSVPNHFWMRKTSEFRSEPFSADKKPWNSVPNHFRKRKNFGILFQIISGKRKNLGKRRLLLAALLNSNISRNSVSFRVMEWTLPKCSESHGMSTLFRGITKTISRLFRGIFSERNFDGNHK